MNNYFESHKKNDCNGCGTCALRCPNGAISMVEDYEGFLYPEIDESKCIKCGLCKKICPNNPKNNNGILDKTYIAINNDKKDLSKSSSGGMFSILAKYVLDKKGVVFGVTYNKEHKVVHDYIEKIEDIQRFRESKYVRSDLGNSYDNAKKFLNNKRLVLFTGTPCQCAGLRGYLQNEYDNLITCEIICHANPSPKIFEMYQKNLELIENKKIELMRFRTKEHGWHGNNTFVQYSDGVGYESGLNGFSIAFQRELINRPSCHNCRFCTTIRYSDFTIGDMWGIDQIDSSIKDDNTGISMLCVNTKKGEKVFSQISDKMYTKKIDRTLAFLHNHHCNVPPHKNRSKFFEGIKNGKINENNVKLYLEKYVRTSIYRKILKKGKKIIKKILKNN